MMWTAILPMKRKAERKTRLSPILTPHERADISEHIANHVASVLRGVDMVHDILILSPTPTDLGTGWIADLGRGLNAELDAARRQLADRNLIVMLPDLPLLCADDVEELMAAAGSGIAMAPDRHGAGTNAVACAANTVFPFAFGHNSCARHLENAVPRAKIIRRYGLALDVDQADDLILAQAAGFAMPWLANRDHGQTHHRQDVTA